MNTNKARTGLLIQANGECDIENFIIKGSVYTTHDNSSLGVCYAENTTVKFIDVNGLFDVISMCGYSSILLANSTSVNLQMINT